MMFAHRIGSRLILLVVAFFVILLKSPPGYPFTKDEIATIGRRKVGRRRDHVPVHIGVCESTARIVTGCNRHHRVIADKMWAVGYRSFHFVFRSAKFLHPDRMMILAGFPLTFF